MNGNGTGNGSALVKAAPPEEGRYVGVAIRSLDELGRFSNMVEKSGLAPKGMNAAAIGVAVQMGCELGLSPMQAVQSIGVINGRPAVYGMALLGLVEASGLLESKREYIEQNGKRVDVVRTWDDSVTYVVVVKRKGREQHISSFSVADAKRAGLWGKPGPWTQYPQRMLRHRALGFALSDVFPDVLRGIKTVEELEDYPVTVGPATITTNILPGGETITAEGEVLPPVEEVPVEPKPARNRTQQVREKLLNAVKEKKAEAEIWEPEDQPGVGDAAE